MPQVISDPHSTTTASGKLPVPPKPRLAALRSIERRSNGKHPIYEIRITSEGLIFILILAFISVGAVLRNVNLLILMAGLMIASLLISWRWCVLWLKHLSAERKLPQQLFAKQLSSVQWVCHNQSRTTAWSIELRDQLQLVDDPRTRNARAARSDSEASPSEAVWAELVTNVKTFFWRQVARFFSVRTGIFQEFNGRIHFLQIPPRRHEVSQYRVFFQQRGRYRVGPALLSTRFPFGLIASRILYPEKCDFWVAPELGQLNADWDRRLRSTVLGSDAIMKRRSLEEDEFFGLRPWRSGDGKKHIHWRSSAKHGFPIVKQHEQPDSRDFALVLDLYQASLNASDELEPTQAHLPCPQCELALSFATTVMLNLSCSVHGRVAFAICGRDTSLCISHSHREMMDQAMRELAVAAATPHPDLATTVLQVMESVSSHTPVYIISSRRTEMLGNHLLIADATTASGQLASQLEEVVRWVSVDSAAFRSMFSATPAEQFNSGVSAMNHFAAKWGR